MIALGVAMALLNFLMKQFGHAQLLQPLITEDAIDHGGHFFHNLHKGTLEARVVHSIRFVCTTTCGRGVFV